MNKSDLLAVFGTLENIGKAFARKDRALTKGAISQWGEQIPELREYQLREIFPDIDSRIKAARKQLRASPER